MQDLYVGLIGLGAGVCTTISFVPQVLKILKTKHTKDISLSMYVVLTIGIFLWLIYGIFLKKAPIIMANSVSFVLCLMVIFAKLKYEKGKNRSV
ncbi:MAG: SemiSWEET transporter [Candidatus Omnitrophota bacterium]